MYPAGLRFRQTREALGLTYRDVEKASYQIALKRGLPDFILHISRLADIENRNVVPSLHKLYSLATILHLDPLEISSWYEAPLRQTFQDGASFPPPLTYLSESLLPPVEPGAPGFSAGSDSTELLQRRPTAIVPLPNMEGSGSVPYRYGYVGLSDRRMVPILRPGSTVLIDPTLRQIEDGEWSNEYDRPMYFVEIRNGYRCGWFQKDKTRLFMQPHTLSRCAPEAWRTPEEAEVVGKVVGVVTYLSEPRSFERPTFPGERSGWNRKAL
jgi:transcriptional regulator with XRE-family HTH domain